MWFTKKEKQKETNYLKNTHCQSRGKALPGGSKRHQVAPGARGKDNAGVKISPVSGMKITFKVAAL